MNLMGLVGNTVTPDTGKIPSTPLPIRAAFVTFPAGGAEPLLYASKGA